MNNTEFKRVLKLTERDLEILRALGDGLSPLEISQIKGRRVKLKTVHTYLVNLRDKLRLRTRYQLVAFAVRFNLSGLKRVADTEASLYKFWKNEDAAPQSPVAVDRAAFFKS